MRGFTFYRQYSEDYQERVTALGRQLWRVLSRRRRALPVLILFDREGAVQLQVFVRDDNEVFVWTKMKCSRRTSTTRPWRGTARASSA